MTLSSFFTFTVDLETNMRERDMNRQEHTLVNKGEHVKIVVSNQCEDVCLIFSFYVFARSLRPFLETRHRSTSRAPIFRSGLTFFSKIWLTLELPWSGNTFACLQSLDSYSLPFHHNLEQPYRFHGLQQRCRLLHLYSQLYDPSEAS